MPSVPMVRRILSRGRGVCVALVGPAGIGKSHVATRTLDDLPCTRVHVSGDASPGEILGRLPVARGEPAWLEALGRRATRGEHLGAHDAATAVLGRLRQHAPAVLVVDHLHLAPAEHADFWVTLGRLTVGTRGVATIGLTRHDPPDGWTAVPVPPLDLEGCASLVRDHLGGPVPPGLDRWLFDRASGHPQFTLELLRHLDRVGALRTGGDPRRWRPPEDDRVPTTVEALVRAQVPAHPAVWPVLSVLVLADGGGPDLAELAGLRPGEAHEALSALERTGLVREQRLALPLHRDVLAPSIPHEPLTRVAERLARAGRLVHADHAVRVLDGGHPGDAAFGLVLTAAAEQASARGRTARAGSLWLRAADLAGGTARRAARLHAARALRPTDARAALGIARDVALEEPADTPGCREAWELTATLVAETDDDARQQLAGAPSDWQEALHDLVLLERVEVAHRRKSQAVAVRLWEALTPELQRRAPPHVRLAYGTSLFFVGRIDDAERELSEVVATATDPLVLGQALHDLALVPQFRARYEEARVLHQRVLDVAAGLPRSADRARLEALAKVGLSGVLQRLDRLQESIEVAREVIVHERECGTLETYVRALLRLAGSLNSAGDFEAGERLLLEAHDLSRYFSGPYRTSVLIMLISLHSWWNSERSGAMQLHFASELEREIAAKDSQVARELQSLAVALSNCGQGALALEYAERSLREARDSGLANSSVERHGLYVRGRARVALGDVAGGVDDLEAASRAAGEAGDTLQAEHYGLWAAHCAGDAVREADLLATFERRGFQGLVHAIRSRGRLAAPPEAAPLARLELLGEVRAFAPDGQPYRSRQGRTLLALLACARLTGEDGVGAERAALAIFPDRDPDAAQDALRSLVRRIRASLGTGSVRAAGGRYALGDVRTDAQEFLDTGDPAWWRGPFLADQALAEDSENAGHLLQTRLEAATLGRIATEPQEAARLAGILITSEPYEPRHVRTLLRALDAAGRPRQARAAYERARLRFEEVGEVLPADWKDYLTRAARETDPHGPTPVLLAADRAGSAARQARELGVHRSTVARWRSGASRPDQRGRPAKLHGEALDELLRVARTRPAGGDAWTLARLAEHLRQASGVSLSRAQLSRILRRNGVTLGAAGEDVA